MTAWAGMIRVDNTTYTWMGDLGPSPVTQTSFEYTSTRSTFIMSVGGVEMNITFLSPIEPDDMRRQSLVFSYLDVVVQSEDGAAHEVQLYVDISAGRSSHVTAIRLLTFTTEWVAGDHSSVAQWDYDLTNDNIAYHKVYRQEQLLFSETNQQADWGSWYWATENGPNLTFQSGPDVTVRGAFQSNGILANSKDTNFRPIDQNWPVFGFASDLGSVKAPVNTLYTLGLAQEQAIQFDGKTGIVPLNSLWTRYFSSETDAVSPYFAFA